MAESDNILTKLQDLLVYLIPQLNKFPRDQKFVLGDRNSVTHVTLNLSQIVDIDDFILQPHSWPKPDS